MGFMEQVDEHLREEGKMVDSLKARAEINRKKVKKNEYHAKYAVNGVHN